MFAVIAVGPTASVYADVPVVVMLVFGFVAPPL